MAYKNQTAYSKKLDAQRGVKPLGRIEQNYHDALEQISSEQNLTTNNNGGKLAAIRWLVDQYFASSEPRDS